MSYLFFIIFALLSISLIYAWFSLAPWVPTGLKDLERVNKIASLKPGQVFLEIGCGNGRVCTYIAKRNPQTRVIAIELAFFFYLLTRIRILLFGPKNVKIIFGDALKYSVSNADVIYTFAMVQALNEKIKSKLIKEMKQEASFISYLFSMNEWPGKKITYKETEKTFPIHVYQKSTI